jgi:hypothetical protein
VDSLRPNEPYMMAHGRSSGWFRSADAREAFCRLHDTALAASPMPVTEPDAQGVDVAPADASSSSASLALAGPICPCSAEAR